MRRASFVAALLLGQLCLAGDCVDGVTPDCSDPNIQCGPDVDASARDGSSDGATTDTSPPIDTGAPNDAASDASSDADADAGDQ